MANYFYDDIRDKFQTGVIDLATDTIKVMLLDSTHVDSSVDEFIDDVSLDEINATGYTTGGETLGTKTVGVVAPGVFDAADADFGLIGNGTNSTIGHAVIYKDTGTPATSPLIAHIDVVSPAFPVTTSGVNFTMTWDSSGIWILPANAA